MRGLSKKDMKWLETAMAMPPLTERQKRLLEFRLAACFAVEKVYCKNACSTAKEVIQQLEYRAWRIQTMHDEGAKDYLDQIMEMLFDYGGSLDDVIRELPAARARIDGGVVDSTEQR